MILYGSVGLVQFAMTLLRKSVTDCAEAVPVSIARTTTKAASNLIVSSRRFCRALITVAHPGPAGDGRLITRFCVPGAEVLCHSLRECNGKPHVARLLQAALAHPAMSSTAKSSSPIQKEETMKRSGSLLALAVGIVLSSSACIAASRAGRHAHAS